MKKTVSICLATLLAMGLFSIMPLSAAAAAPVVSKVTYEGRGQVDVDFRDDVVYSSGVKVTLKDNLGQSYRATITDKDNDSLDFTIQNFRAKRTYTFTITGIRARGESAATVRGTVVVPSITKVVIERTKYEGSGKVEVDFVGRVAYSGASVSVKDSSGKTYRASICDKDSDELDFKVAGIAAGKTYRFTIKGIRNADGNVMTTVSGSFKTPAAALVTIREIEYDEDDRELSVEFSRRVNYRDAKATVKDANGKSYGVRILEKDGDEMDLYVSGLRRGQKYTLSISGVKASTATSYTTVKKNFYAIDD